MYTRSPSTAGRRIADLAHGGSQAEGHVSACSSVESDGTDTTEDDVRTNDAVCMPLDLGAAHC